MLNYIFSGSRCTRFIETSHQTGCKIEKTLLKISFSGVFSKAETEECDQKVWKAFDQLDVVKFCSTTYFLEVRACVSLKLATKGFLGGKKNSKNLAYQVVLLKQI